MMTKVTLRNLTAHKLRLALTALSVVLGVAMVAGTFIFTDSMSKQFDDLFAGIGKNVAVDVRAKQAVQSGSDEQVSSRPPVPAALADELRKVEGVKDVVGNVGGYAAVIGKNGKTVATLGPPQMGMNWVNGGDYDIQSGRAPQGPSEVAIDEATMKKAGYGLGDRARILLQGPTQTMTVVGVIKTGNMMGATVTAFDTATAQRLLLKPGYFNDIQLVSSGVGETVLRDRVARTLPGDVEAITGSALRDELKDDIQQLLSFLQVLLLVFGLIAVFVGAFIIFNTFSMLVAQRTRELALLRAIGASRRQVTRAVMGEALGVGIVGSTIGLLAGVGLAAGLQALMSDGSEGSTGLTFTVTPVIWSYAVGVTITLISAYFPSRRAAKIAPVAAMRDDVALPQRSLRRRAGIGSALTVLGAGLVVAGIADAGPEPLLLLGIGVGMVFIGVAVLAPILSKPVIRVLGGVFPRLFGTPGRLARENALRNPRRTAATASALMIGLALVSAINVVNSSAVASIGRSVDRQFGADYMIISETQGGFSPDAIKAVGQAPGVDQATAMYVGNINVNGKRASVLSGDMAGITEGAKLKMLSGSTDLGADGLLVDEDTAKSNDYKVGSTLPAQFTDGARQQLRVAGIYEKNDVIGSRLLSEQAYLAHTAKPLAFMGMVQVATPGTASKQAVEGALRDYPNLQVQDRSEVKESFQKQLDQVVVFFTILLAMSIIIAAVGVINTLALSVVERTREIGLLRAVGVSRRQLRRMIRLESVVIAVFGALLGIGIGVALGAAVQNGLADQGLDILKIPVVTLVVYVVLGGVIGMLAALWPAWRAGRMDVLKAIATE
ncbi:ABC transporter permease [Actinomadura alba]|nr:ABC transporter permease [Actinomadura alba]